VSPDLFLSYFARDFWLKNGYANEIGNILESSAGESLSAVAPSDCDLSNLLESALRALTESSGYGSAAFSAMEKFSILRPHLGLVLAGRAAQVNLFKLTLCFYVLMREMDGNFDRDYAELVPAYLLRDRIYFGVKGEHIGKLAREWAKMIKGLNSEHYGETVICRGLYDDD
jgi:hypothetical protein